MYFGSRSSQFHYDPLQEPFFRRLVKKNYRHLHLRHCSFRLLTFEPAKLCECTFLHNADRRFPRFPLSNTDTVLFIGRHQGFERILRRKVCIFPCFKNRLSIQLKSAKETRTDLPCNFCYIPQTNRRLPVVHHDDKFCQWTGGKFRSRDDCTC